MYFYIICAVLWQAALFASHETALKKQPTNVTAQGAPSTFVNGTVHAIDGTFCYTFCHLKVPGAVPLDLVQHYNSKMKYTSWLGIGMNLNYSFWIHGCLDSGKKNDTDEKYEAVLAEAEGGSIIRCLGKGHHADGEYYYFIDPDVVHEGLTNCGSGEISARTNLKNCYFKLKAKVPQHGDWTAFLPDGTIKEYHRTFCFEDAMNAKGEQCPDGTRLQYDYHTNGDIKNIVAKRYHTQNWLRFDSDHHKGTVHSSNGKKVAFSLFKKDDHIYIDEIESSENPKIKLHYTKAGDHYAIDQISWPHGRFLEIQYDHKGRVEAQKAPVGKDGEKRTIYTFTYHPDSHYTEVHDANSAKSIYRYKNNRLTALEQYQHHKIFRTKALYWGEKKGLSWGKHPKTDEGNLIAEAILDSDDKAHWARHFSYDDYGNVTKETLYGNLTGSGKMAFGLSSAGVPYDHHVEHVTTHYTYSHDRLRLKETETHPSGLHIKYRYKKHSDLVWAKITCNGDKILFREFFSYDSDSILIEKILDDGITNDKNNLKGVTQRLITNIRPVKNQEGHGQGLPEEILERYLDITSGNLIWLKRTEYSYNKAGHVTEEKVFDANNTHRYTIETTYDDMGRVKNKTNALGERWLYDYDPNSNKTYERLQGAGFYTNFHYDHANRLIRKTEHHEDGTTKEQRFEYDLMGNSTASIDHYGNTTHYEYDDCNRLKKTTLPRMEGASGSTHCYTIEKKYDIFDNVIQETDQEGHTTCYEYSARGKPCLITYADGSKERFEYNKEGTLAYARDKSGTKTSYTYDVLGRVLTIKIHDTPKTKNSYNAFHLKTSTDAMGHTTYFNYDGAGRKIEEWKNVDDNFSKTTFEYDTLGHLSCIKAHYGFGHDEHVATYFEYDLINRLTQEKKVDGQGTCISCVEYEYDTLGNCKKVTRQLSEHRKAVRTTKHNSKSEPVRIIDEYDFETTLEHDHTHTNPFGQKTLLKKSSDPLGNTNEEFFDALERLVFIQKKNRQGTLLAQTFFGYNGTGKKRFQKEYAVLDGAIDHEFIVWWEYDALDRVEKIVEQPGSAEEKITCYDYDAVGRIFHITKPDGVVLTHSYDGLGRLSELRSSDSTVAYTYTYDLHNNPIEIVDEVSGLITKRRYDAWNRVVSDGIQDHFVTAFSYDPLGRLTSLTAPDGSLVTYQYDKAHLRSVKRNDYEHVYHSYDLQEHVVESGLIGQTGNQLQHWDKKGRNVHIETPHFAQNIPSDGFDAAGNLKKLTFTDAIGQVKLEASYDDLYQLVQESGVQTHSYTNDSLHNRHKKDDVAYALDHANKIVNQGFVYDKNGNLKEKDCVHFTYDALDRLIKVTKGTEVTTYTYDCFHRRIARNNTYFLHLGLREIGFFDDGELTQFRVLGLGKGAELGASVVIELDGVPYAPIHDHRGNIVCLVDPSTGKPKETYRYTAFGECVVYDEASTPIPQSKLNNPWQFASKRYDPETELVYFSKRYYFPELGRWITPDPLGLADGPNLYAYVHNNPLSHFDLFGLYALSIEKMNQLDTPSQELETNRREFRQAPPFSQKVSSQSHWMRVGERKIPGIDIVAINGVSNTKEGARQNFEMISKMGGGVRVDGLYNASHGWGIIDFCEAIAQVNARIVTPPSVLYADYLIDYHLTHPKEDRCFTLCHSQGAAIARNTLSMLAKDVRDRTIVLTIGPAAIISDDICFKARNYISTSDPIPMLNLLGIIENHNYVDYVMVHEDANLFFDHEFSSPTYKDPIQKGLNEYIDKYRKER